MSVGFGSKSAKTAPVSGAEVLEASTPGPGRYAPQLSSQAKNVTFTKAHALGGRPASAVLTSAGCSLLLQTDQWQSQLKSVCAHSIPQAVGPGLHARPQGTPSQTAAAAELLSSIERRGIQSAADLRQWTVAIDTLTAAAQRKQPVPRARKQPRRRQRAKVPAADQTQLAGLFVEAAKQQDWASMWGSECKGSCKVRVIKWWQVCSVVLM